MALGIKAGFFVAVTLLGLLLFALLIAILSLTQGGEVASQIARTWFLPMLLLSALVAAFIVWRKLIPLTPFIARMYPQAAVVETPAQARAEVNKQHQAGVDFIKPYDYLDRETYLTAVGSARDLGLYAAGHIPEDPDFISVDDALSGGLREIAHVDEMTHEFLIGFDPKAKRGMDWEIDMARIDELAAVVAAHQAAVTATLVTNETVLLGLEDLEALFQRPEYRLVKPEKLEAWRSKGRLANWKGQEAYRRQKMRPLWMQLAAALHKHSVPVLLGTDSDVEGIVPGAAEHRELALLVETGFTPFEALAAGTRDAARIAGRMNVADDWGTIVPGNVADLVLLDQNPLDDIANSTAIQGVMLRGRWLPKEELDRQVAYLGGAPNETSEA